MGALFAAVDAAQELYRAELAGHRGAEARAYLAQRRVPDPIIDAEGVGAVGTGWTTLRDHLVTRGIPLPVAEAAGLIRRRHRRVLEACVKATGSRDPDPATVDAYFQAHLADDPELYYDFPLCKRADGGSDRAGRWVTLPLRVRDGAGTLRIGGFQYRSLRPLAETGFGGRWMSPPRTPLLDWNHLIVGLEEAREQVARSGILVLNEGRFDHFAVRAAVMGLPQDRMPGVASLGGVSLRGAIPQLAELAPRKLLILPDEDENWVGQTAAVSMGLELHEAGLPVRVGSMRDGAPASTTKPLKDASALAQHLGPGAVLQVIERGLERDLATYAFDVTARKLACDPMGGQVLRRVRAARLLAEVIHAVPGDRRSMVRRAAEACAWPASVIERCLAEHGAGIDRGTHPVADPAPAQSGRAA